MTEPVNLPEIFELAKKATPGPWEINEYTNYEGYSICAPQVGCIAERWPAAGGNELRPVGELIVASINALPAIEEAFGELKALLVEWTDFAK